MMMMMMMMLLMMLMMLMHDGLRCCNAGRDVAGRIEKYRDEVVGVTNGGVSRVSAVLGCGLGQTTHRVASITLRLFVQGRTRPWHYLATVPLADSGCMLHTLVCSATIV